MKILVSRFYRYWSSSGSKANVILITNLNQAGFEVVVYHYTLKNITLKNINTVAIQN
jgi:hypothetical protein